jgi:hypothetical protein
VSPSEARPRTPLVKRYEQQLGSDGPARAAEPRPLTPTAASRGRRWCASSHCVDGQGLGDRGPLAVAGVAANWRRRASPGGGAATLPAARPGPTSCPV